MSLSLFDNAATLVSKSAKQAISFDSDSVILSDTLAISAFKDSTVLEKFAVGCNHFYFALSALQFVLGRLLDRHPSFLPPGHLTK
ncbi:hypothetical protein BpHYR1_002890 [Brachionus plicatilis]|uniref:Uncharacterized protein n=1 Tax=Brachionus plicatilis TaxID=10195 RepID=A0A3M7P9B2_BRAPC|nr:hypothetical protein BpHYR1_002890 [Brachionus plicatilis]